MVIIVCNFPFKNKGGIQTVKKTISLLLVIMMTISLTSIFASAAEHDANIDISNVTLGQIQDIFHGYLESSGLQLIQGTETYYSYILDQLLNRSDAVLLKHEYYDLIHSYMVEYKLAYEDYLLCSDSLANENCSADVVATISNTNTCITYNEEEEEVKFTVSDEFLSQTIGNIAYVNQMKPQVIKTTITPNASYTYSGSEAATYAKLHANDYNDAYPSYSADCTNYVSQCVYAGGIPMDGSNASAGTYESTTDWYCIYISSFLWIRKYSVTTSWIRVSDFSAFMSSIATASTHTSISSLYDACEIGDIVQLADKNTGSAYHSIIITDKDSSSAYYCGHSNDRNNVAIEDTLDESYDNFILFDFTN